MLWEKCLFQVSQAGRQEREEVHAGSGLGTAKEGLSGWPGEKRQEARRKERGTLMGGQEDMRQTLRDLTEWAGIKYQMRRQADPATARWSKKDQAPEQGGKGRRKGPVVEALTMCQELHLWDGTE